jgi:single-strand DNA-binding protein
MSYGLNKVMLIGNLGRDPEMKYTDSGKAVVRFSIATNESYKGQDGNLVKATEWHNIVAWGKLAELFNQFLKKGKKIYVEGKIRTRSWDDKEGIKHYMTEIIADDFMFLDGVGRDDAGGDDSSMPTPTSDAGNGGGGEDLPF